MDDDDIAFNNIINDPTRVTYHRELDSICAKIKYDSKSEIDDKIPIENKLVLDKIINQYVGLLLVLRRIIFS